MTITSEEAIMVLNEIIVHRMRRVISGSPATLRILGLGAVAVGVVMVASMQMSTTQAASQMAVAVGAMETFDYSVGFDASPGYQGLWSAASDAMVSSWPAIPESPGIAGSGNGGADEPSREVYVWATLMTAGMATNGTMTYIGYMPRYWSGHGRQPGPHVVHLRRYGLFGVDAVPPTG